MRHVVFVLLASVLVGSGLARAQAIQVEDLRCEYLKDPLGIDAAQPRLSWILESQQRGQRQTAYQVLVASSPAALDRDQGDVWDSGKVASDETAQVAYAGKPLASRRSAIGRSARGTATASPAAGANRPAGKWAS